jgi:hypothetical protein
MKARGILGGGLAVVVSGMRSLFTDASLTEVRSSDEEEKNDDQLLKMNTVRKASGEEVLVFAAVASAYLLAWAASLVFQQ